MISTRRQPMIPITMRQSTNVNAYAAAYGRDMAATDKDNNKQHRPLVVGMDIDDGSTPSGPIGAFFVAPHQHGHSSAMRNNPGC